MGITEDPNDPRLPAARGPDAGPVPQQDVYLVLSADERAKGFVRPVRREYTHVGAPRPAGLRELTDDERTRYAAFGYAAFEPYPESRSPLTGRYWTQKQLDDAGKGCGVTTTMGLALAETYARDPRFYGATYCVGCRMHLPVGEHGVFVWTDGSRVGT